MIEPSELLSEIKLGSFLYHKELGGCRVNGFHKRKVWVTKDESPLKVKLTIEELKPIPLGYEWLTKLDFVREEDGFDENYYDMRNDDMGSYYRRYVFLTAFEHLIELREYDVQYAGGFFPTFFEYWIDGKKQQRQSTQFVHNLQNFFLDSTGLYLTSEGNCYNVEDD